MLRQFNINLLPKEIQRIALFLDVDGTLYEIRETPDLVKPCFKLQNKLFIIHKRLKGAMGLVSGRSLSDIDRIFDKTPIPVAGNHGAQLRDARRLKEHLLNIRTTERIFCKIKELIGGQVNFDIENKGSNIAIHFRNSKLYVKEVKKKIIKLIKSERELTWIEGKNVLEIKSQCHDKGTAISYFMCKKPFINRKPIFIGDDVSDEDGFETVNRIGGWSVRVGKYKKSKAKYFLPNVKSVHEILNQLSTPR